MEPLRKIHSMTVENRCFREVFNSSEIRALLEVDKLSLQGNVDNKEKIVNEVLLKLTIIHRIFNLCLSRKTNCGHLNDVANYLIDKNAMSILTPLMNDSSQHVVYLTTKAISSLLTYASYLINKDDFQSLLHDCLKFEWKAIYIFEIARQILSHFCGQDEQTLREVKTFNIPPCCCISSTRCSYQQKCCFGDFLNLMIEDWDTILSTHTSLWKNILHRYTSMAQKYEESTRTSADKLLEEHENISLKVNQEFCQNYIEMSIKDEQIFISILNFLSMFLKSNFQSNISGKEVNFQRCQETSLPGIIRTRDTRKVLKIIPAFAHILQVGKLSTQVWKAILELLSGCIFINSAPNDIVDNPKITSTLGIHSASAVIGSISAGALDNIPLYHGFVGFGGEMVSMHHSAEFKLSDSTKPHCGIFRQISLLILKSSLIMLKHFQNCKYDKKELIFKALTKWCNHLHIMVTESKVDISEKDCEVLWCAALLEVFADQDEEVIEMMLLLLKIHRTLTQKGKFDQMSTSMKVFNPHLIFAEFLKVVHFDHSVLVDFLVSSETVFLEYLVEYLHLVEHDWEGFCQSFTGQEASSGCCKLKPNSSKLQNNLLKHNQETKTNSVIDSSIFKDKMEASRFDSINKRDVGGLGCLSFIVTSYASDSSDDEDIDDNVGSVNGKGSCDNISDDGGDIYNDEDDNVCDVDKRGSAYSSNIHEDVEMVYTTTISNPPMNIIPELGNTQERIMSTLIHTRISIERLVSSGLFPYNVTPLLRILKTVENMYDGC